jgi:glycosyltransferase involved in cell wall biosynthesis
MSKKKILFVITHLELGGAQKQLLSLIQGLDNNIYDLSLVAGDYGFLRGDFNSIKKIKLVLLKSLTRKIHPWWDLISFFKIYFFIKKNHFDIVHLHSPKASFLGRWAAFLAGVDKIVYTVHGWPFHRFMNKFHFWCFLWLEKLTALITDVIITVSREDYRTGVEYNIASSNKLKLVHYGIDLKRFKGIYQYRRVHSSFSNIFTVSSFKPQKGVFYFIALAQALIKEKPWLKFFILGNGPLYLKVKRYLADKGLQNKIILTGWQKDITVTQKKAFLFVLTSLWEGLPVSVIESVIAGVPVVVTDTGGIHDIVNNKQQGLIVGCKQQQELFAAVTNILNNYQHWYKIITINRGRINLNHWSQVRRLKQLDFIYRGIND